uniref:Large ribosomal subunit protein bL33m n=1 Tax=Moschus moschiferus TaxID=68415 RepID=A0A8C6E471_MOSMO
MFLGDQHHFKSKTILVKMVSQTGTGFSFNTKRSRLWEKLTLLHYDPVVKKKVLFVEQKKYAPSKQWIENEFDL